MAITVDNFQPNLDSEIEAQDSVSFDVRSGESIIEGFVLVLAFFESQGLYEVIHDGVSGGFAPRYAHASTRSPISAPNAGFAFKVSRVGGWPEKPVLRVIAFEGFA